MEIKATNPKIGETMKTPDGPVNVIPALCGDTLWIFSLQVWESSWKELRRRAIKGGLKIDWMNGTYTEWHDEEVLDFSKSGSEMYTWHKDGDRNLHTRWRVLRDSKTGDTIEKVKERNLYKLMD